jgi:TetR/AcrR family transcriptional regulator, cholesterol catabolism regulator
METQNTKSVSLDPLTAKDLAQKERIIETVRGRILADGFSRLSVDEIAAMFGMSKKTFYKFFPTKEDLINQVADKIMAEARVNLSGIAGSDKDFVSKIHELMSFVMLQSTRISKALQDDVQRYAPDLWKRIEEFRTHRISEVFTHLIEQGIKEGYVRTDVNERVFLLAVNGAVRAVVNPTVLAQESFSAHDAVQNMLTLFFTGILTDQGRTGLKNLRKIEPSSPQSKGAQ